MIHYVIQAMAHCELTVIGHWNSVYKFEIKNLQISSKLLEKSVIRDRNTAWSELVLFRYTVSGPMSS